MKISNKKLIHHKPHELIIDKEKIKINDGVFTPNPKFSYSTSFILNHLPVLKDKTVLDMGTGTGIIAIVCAKNGARGVLGIDCDDKAITNAQENILKSQFKKIELLKSNLYENVTGTFDYIFANLPILDELWNINEKTTAIIERFLRESPKYLNPGGKIYLTWFSASNIKDVQNIIDGFCYEVELITEKKLGFNWYLFILSIK